MEINKNPIEKAAALLADQMAATVLLMRHRGYSEAAIAQELQKVFAALACDGIWTPAAITALKIKTYEIADERLEKLIAQIDHAAAESSTQH